VTQRAEVFSPQPIEHAAPELAVAADVVVAVRVEGAPVRVQPQLLGLVAQMFPHGLRIPVLLLLGDEVAALEDENPRLAFRQGVRDGTAARAGADDDDVEVQQ
jgi:hypothetical protein